MIEYYTVENTGWSGGISWFETGGTRANPLRFKTEQEAIEYANACKADPDTLWRVVYTTFTREPNKETTIRTFKSI